MGLDGLPSGPNPIRLESLVCGERSVEELTPQEATTMLTALAGIQLALANRILTAKPPQSPPKPDDSKMLKVEEVAAILNTGRRTVYAMSRRQDWRHFTIRLSRKHLRFREVWAEEVAYAASQPGLVRVASTELGLGQGGARDSGRRALFESVQNVNQ
jgi:hypothetical protein